MKTGALKGQILRRLTGLIALVSGVWVVTIIGQTSTEEPSAGWTLLWWNDLGRHWMDEDFSVFSILPPFNTVNAQLEVGYAPKAGFQGTDFFTYCAMDDRTDSNLGTVRITVGKNAGFVDAGGDGLADLLEKAFLRYRVMQR